MIETYRIIEFAEKEPKEPVSYQKWQNSAKHFLLNYCNQNSLENKEKKV